MQTVRNIVNLAGRSLLAAVFLASALTDKIPHFHRVVERMTVEGVPFPSFLLTGAIVFLLFGSLSVLFGFKARCGASLLVVFTILGTYYFHDFWAYDDPAIRQQFFKSFMKNLSLIGALLILIANGPGAISFDPQEKK